MKFNQNRYWKNKGFRQFLIRTGLFVGLVLLMQLVTIPYQKYSLPSKLSPLLNPDLGQALLFTIAAFLIIGKDNLLKLKKAKRSAFFTVILSVLFVLLIIGYILLKIHLAKNPQIVNTNLALWIVWRYTHLAIILLAAFFVAFDYAFLKKNMSVLRREIMYSGALFVAFFILSILLRQLWHFLSTIVAKVSIFLLGLTYPQVISEFPAGRGPIVAVEGFRVSIGKPCSGVDSTLLFIGIYLLIFLLDRKKMDASKFWTLFPLAILGIFAMNLIRVYLLLLVGIELNPDFAVGVFHSNIGWIIFVIYSLIFWYFAYGWLKK